MWSWPLTSKITKVHPLIMGNICAKFDQNTRNSLISIVFTRLFPLKSIVTLTSEINRVHPLIMGNICAKFDQNKRNSLIPLCSQGYFHLGLSWPWPLKSIGYNLLSWATIVPSLIKIPSMAWSLLCSQGYIHFRVLWPWPLKSIECILSSWLTFLSSLMKACITVKSLLHSYGQCMDTGTEPQMRYWFLSATFWNTLHGDNKALLLL